MPTGEHPATRFQLLARIANAAEDEPPFSNLPDLLGRPPDIVRMLGVIVEQEG
jgi:hypothetical protein